MEQVETEVRRIAHTRVRDALLHLTRDGPRELGLGRIANRAAIEPAVTAKIVTELEADGLFRIERCGGDGEPRWRVG
jgi:DNA-binding IscR family transcriptional regulator